MATQEAQLKAQQQQNQAALLMQQQQQRMGMKNIALMGLKTFADHLSNFKVCLSLPRPLSMVVSRISQY